MGRKAKPMVLDIECPCCNSQLLVKVFKTRRGQPEPAEYDIHKEVTVERQGKLFGEFLAQKDKAAVTTRRRSAAS